MATYKGIQGRSVQKLSSDPGTIEDVTGQLWYNSTTGTFKLSTEQALATGSWSSAPALNNAKYYFNGAGDPTAGLVVSGNPGYGQAAEQYDGSSWTEIANMTIVHGMSGVNGTSTAALAVGGNPGAPNYVLCEDWNGTSWAAINSLNTGRANSGPSIGTVTAATVMGGAGASGATENYNGTCWTETGDTMNSPAVQGKAGFGIQDSCMSVAGEPSATVSETYNGTTWTEGNDVNTGRGNCAGSGTITAGIFMGGSPYPVGNYSETYDGTSWSAGPTTSQSHGSGCAGGSVGSGQASAFCAGGYAPGLVANVDFWTYDQYVAKTVTVS